MYINVENAFGTDAFAAPAPTPAPKAKVKRSIKAPRPLSHILRDFVTA